MNPFRKKFNPLENWEDFFKVLLIVVVAGGAMWVYGDFSKKSKCEELVYYVPAKGGTSAGVWSTASEESYFAYGAEKFESRDSAIVGCLREMRR